MNHMEFSPPPQFRNEIVNPIPFNSEPTPAVNSESSHWTNSNELQKNPAFRAHLARLSSIREKVILQARENASYDRAHQQKTTTPNIFGSIGNRENENSESIISFDYRPTSATPKTSSSLSEEKQLEVPEIFLSKLERLISQSYQERNTSG